MALNCSHQSVFSSHLVEENLVTPMRIANGCLMEGISERNREGHTSQWSTSRDVCDRFDYDGGDKMDWETVLPADPFGMDISSTVTAITGLLGYFEADYGGYGRTDVGGVSKGDSSFFAEFNILFNKAIDVHPHSGINRWDDRMSSTSVVDRCFGEESTPMFCDIGVGSYRSTKVGNFGNGNSSIAPVNHQKIVAADSDDGAPHQAMSFALGYLGVIDLLNVEKVCKFMRTTVQNDPLLWKTIRIDHPLNDRITDDILVQLTSRAQGNLQCLDLVECQRVTDDGLKRVLESNLRLTQLSVPGCTRLSIDGIVSSLRAFKMMAITGIKHLRVGGLYGVTQEHYEELISLLGAHNHGQANNHQPHFYYRGNFYISIEDGRLIDIEMCPRCQNFKLVYDCPAESCQGKGHAAQLCRACTICIPRCAQCGKCINDGEYEETFCLELLCSYCWKQISKCHEKHNIELNPSKNAVCQELVVSYHG